LRIQCSLLHVLHSQVFLIPFSLPSILAHSGFTICSLELLKLWGILRMGGTVWLFSELQLATCAARTWQYDLQGAQMWCPLFLKRPSTIPQQ
jgi:hypothetical protein